VKVDSKLFFTQEIFGSSWANTNAGVGDSSVGGDTDTGIQNTEDGAFDDA
jgi:hypothetical protein